MTRRRVVGRAQKYEYHATAAARRPDFDALDHEGRIKRATRLHELSYRPHERAPARPGRITGKVLDDLDVRDPVRCEQLAEVAKQALYQCGLLAALAERGASEGNSAGDGDVRISNPKTEIVGRNVKAGAPSPRFSGRLPKLDPSSTRTEVARRPTR